MNKRALVWPHGHRVAVVCSVLLETWSDGKSPSYFPRTTPLPPGSKDVAGINWSRFGGNEGIWRLSRNLKDLDMPAKRDQLMPATSLEPGGSGVVRGK